MQVSRNQRPRIVGGQDVYPTTLSKLLSTTEGALDYFEDHFGTLNRPVQIDLRAEQKAMRTGYNLVEDVICFPRLEQVKNAGLDSQDVVHHEIFHAALCQAYPHLPTDTPEARSLHEALADYFAYQLCPDEQFGEDYEIGKSELRRYRNHLCISLCPGDHARGSAITSKLLELKVMPCHIQRFLAQGDFSLEALAAQTPELLKLVARDTSFALEKCALNYPPSALGRYRISPNKPLELSFQANTSLMQDHPDLNIHWTTPDGLPSRHYSITPGAPGTFHVAPKGEAPPEKLLALYIEHGALIGSSAFYFSRAKAYQPGR